jgi:hypothetical protein
MVINIVAPACIVGFLLHDWLSRMMKRQACVMRRGVNGASVFDFAKHHPLIFISLAAYFTNGAVFQGARFICHGRGRKTCIT